MSRIITHITIDKDNIIYDLTNSLTQGELIEIIKELNREVADIDFTKELRDYFINEMDEEEEEESAFDYIDTED